MDWAGGAFAEICVLHKFLPYRTSYALTVACLLKSRFDFRYFSDPRVDNCLLCCVIANGESVLKAVEPVVLIAAKRSLMHR